MASSSNSNQLPCDGGICMICKQTPLDGEILNCNTCATPWHMSCLLSLPENFLGWVCPDCAAPEVNVNVSVNAGPTGVRGESSGLIALIQAIEADTGISDLEKAKKRQMLHSRDAKMSDDEAGDRLHKQLEGFNCSICLSTMDKPVTTECGHNSCLPCFKKWTRLGKNTCAECRSELPKSMINNPLVNMAMMEIIRKAKSGEVNVSKEETIVARYIHNKDRPDTSFRSDRAKRGGNGNASSGRIMVTVPTDHFGPILAEHDPERNRGVLVGDGWITRLDCRQWGAHFPHIAGISGQAKHGSQSVVLSGGYEDDEDHGQWFLYTGSGGRDFSGNKRVTNDQSTEQRFVKRNEALRLSCEKGYPIRVVRSCKEKRSPYAPSREAGHMELRYDGIYRVEKCWRKEGKQGFIVCRYLFVRCDNAPAPWTCDAVRGDLPRDLPVVDELSQAMDVFERKDKPTWDYDTEDGCWKWTCPPPASKRKPIYQEGREGKRIKRTHNDLKELDCIICKKLMVLPTTTPCAHNFCKGCLEGVFAGHTLLRDRTSASGRNLRAKKNVMKCPSCEYDITDFLQKAAVNRELQEYIESLQKNEIAAKAKTKEKGKQKIEEEYEDDEEDEEEEVEDEYAKVNRDIEIAMEIFFDKEEVAAKKKEKEKKLEEGEEDFEINETENDLKRNDIEETTPYNK